MKVKIIQLFFLVAVGLIISWREWTSMVRVEGMNQQIVSAVGSNAESTLVFAALLLGIVLAIVANGIWIMLQPKLSSPNSV